MHIFVLVLRAAVDDLDLVEVHEDAPRHGFGPLTVVLSLFGHCKCMCMCECESVLLLQSQSIY